ncbi:MAG: hypothetical protein QOF54_216, partial [Solirubrobacteraceae bacterium]|nr:hypothetical protein [Solirubrobacteraceae bacterium]
RDRHTTGTKTLIVLGASRPAHERPQAQ